MKRAEYAEGPEAAARFVGAMRKILSVSHDEMKRREEEYKLQSALNPKRRGPKKNSVFPGPADQPLS